MADQFDPKKWVETHEGFRDDVYLDSRGLPTVGVGHLVTPKSPHGIAQAQVGDRFDAQVLNNLYNEDYIKHADQARKNFKNFDKHPPNVQEALINMTFQMGNKPSRWKNFNNALQEGLETGNYQNAAYHGSDSKWFREQTPKRARSVLDRLAYGDKSTYAYTRPEEFNELPDYAIPQPAQHPAVAPPPPAPAAPDFGHSGQELSDDEFLAAEEAALDAYIRSKGQGYADGKSDTSRKALEVALEALGTGAGELLVPGGGGIIGRGVGTIAADKIGDAAYDFGAQYGPAIAGTGKEIGSWFGYAHGAMTNPEAGPSDTVPAMLTPGEAVIPASVAQDPDMKPVIEEMVDEGRKRNRNAESAGIPVNHPAAIGLSDGSLDSKISKLYGEGYDAPGQAYAIAKDMGYMGGSLGVAGYADGKSWTRHLPQRLENTIERGGDVKRGAETGYRIYKAIDDYHEKAKESAWLPEVPTWDDPLTWETVKTYAKPGLKAAEMAGRWQRELGFQGGTDMVNVPKPMGAPPKYNIDRPDHSEFNVPSENMGEGMSMDLANAKHRQQVANKEGDQAQKMDHARETDMHKMQMDQMKGMQKLQQKMAEQNLDMQHKMDEESVDSEVAKRKQAALTASMGGLGMTPPPIESPPPGPAGPIGMMEGGWTHNAGVGGYADGLTGVAAQADAIRRLQAAGVSMEDIGKYLQDEIGALNPPREVQQAVAPPVPEAMPVPAGTPGQTPGINPTNIPQVNEVMLAAQRRQDATRDIARQAFGAEEEARAWQSGIDNLQGRADGGMIGLDGNPDVIIDGRFYSEHVPPIQGLAGGRPSVHAQPARDTGRLDQSSIEDISALIPGQAPAPPMEQMNYRTGQMEPTNAARHAMQPPPSPQAELDAMKVNPRQTNRQVAENAQSVFDDPTAPPEQRVQAGKTLELATKANEEKNQEAVDQASQEPTEDVTKEIVNDLKDSTTPSKVNDEVDGQASADAVTEADNQPDEVKKEWYHKAAEWFGDNILNGNELAVAATIYGANKLLGFDDQTALQQGLKFAQTKRAASAATEADKQKRELDLQDYQAQQDILQSDRQEIQTLKNEATVAKAAGDLGQAKIKADQAFVKGARAQGIAQIKAATGKGGFAYDEKSGKSVIDATPQKLANEQVDFLRDYGFTEFDSGVATGVMETALRQAAQDSRSGKKIRSLQPYLHEQMMTQESGLGRGAFAIPQKDGSLKPMDVGNLNGLNKIISSNALDDSSADANTRSKRMRALGAKFEALEPDVKAKWNKRAQNRGDVSGFYLFAREEAERVQRKLRGG